MSVRIQPFGLYINCICGSVQPVVFKPCDLDTDFADVSKMLDAAFPNDTPLPLAYAGRVECSQCGRLFGGSMTLSLFCEYPCKDCRLAGTEKCCKAKGGGAARGNETSKF